LTHDTIPGCRSLIATDSGINLFRPIYALYIAGGWLLPGRKRIVPYSTQTLKRLKPALFRQDLLALIDLLRQQAIQPLIAQRFPLVEARRAQELLKKGGVMGKTVLVANEASQAPQRPDGGMRRRAIRRRPRSWLLIEFIYRYLT
jgi:hypothetical protein